MNKYDSKQAYVYCIFGGDSYVPGVIASIASILEAKTTREIVVMVTDVSDKSIKQLKTISRVVVVPYLRFKSKKLKMEKQRDIYTWIDSSYTKWNCLNLDYDKIVFIDADTIVLKSLDHLFDLQAPAATWSSPWANKYKSDKYLKKEEKECESTNFNIEHSKTKTGEIISMQDVDRTVRNNGNSFIASLLVLEPSKEHYNSLVKLCSEKAHLGFNMDVYNGCDEQALTYFYRFVVPKNWTHIHQKYNFIIHKNEWLEGETPEMLHYYNNTKPWMGDYWYNTFWDTDNIWWYYYHKWIVSKKRRASDFNYQIPHLDGSQLLPKDLDFKINYYTPPPESKVLPILQDGWKSAKTRKKKRHPRFTKTHVQQKNEEYFPWLKNAWSIKVP
jgi:lipopolysaccharide biosynthesis glycosyltransferase